MHFYFRNCLKTPTFIIEPIMKATSLVSLIGMRDILYYGDIMRSSNLSQAPLIYVVVLLMYFILALPFVWLTRKGESIAKKGVASQ